MPVNEINDADFKQEVLGSEIPVVVDFYAPWCGPCKMIAPALEEISGEQEGKVKIVKVNIDDNPEAPTEYGVRSVPTLMVFNGGEKVDVKTGAMPKTALRQWIEAQS